MARWTAYASALSAAQALYFTRMGRVAGCCCWSSRSGDSPFFLGISASVCCALSMCCVIPRRRWLDPRLALACNMAGRESRRWWVMFRSFHACLKNRDSRTWCARRWWCWLLAGGAASSNQAASGLSSAWLGVATCWSTSRWPSDLLYQWNPPPASPVPGKQIDE